MNTTNNIPEGMSFEELEEYYMRINDVGNPTRGLDKNIRRKIEAILILPHEISRPCISDILGEYEKFLESTARLLSLIQFHGLLNGKEMKDLKIEARNCKNAGALSAFQHKLYPILYNTDIDYSGILYTSKIIDFPNQKALSTNIQNRSYSKAV